MYGQYFAVIKVNVCFFINKRDGWLVLQNVALSSFALFLVMLVFFHVFFFKS